MDPEEQAKLERDKAWLEVSKSLLILKAGSLAAIGGITNILPQRTHFVLLVITVALLVFSVCFEIYVMFRSAAYLGASRGEYFRSGPPEGVAEMPAWVERLTSQAVTLVSVGSFFVALSIFLIFVLFNYPAPTGI